MKKKNILIISIILLLIIICILLFLLLSRDDKITLVINDADIVSEPVISDNIFVELPVAEEKEGYTFVGWKNEENKIVRKGSKVTKDTVLTAVWIKDDVEKITIEFDINNNEEIDNELVENGGHIILPDDPVKEGYVFGGWVNSDGEVVNDETVFDSDSKLTALWIPEDVETVIIEVLSENDSVISKIVIEKGTNAILPTTPIKEGYVFSGWYDENGNLITVDTVVNENIKIKAKWLKYTCPSDCTQNADGKTCTKVETTSPTKKTGCPSGYTLKENQCLDLKTKYYAISIDSAPWWKCNSSSDGSYDEVFGGGAIRYCAKKTSKVTTEVCPNGYTQDGDTCKKTQILDCTAE